MKVERWVEDPEEVYIKAKILKKDGDKISVETANGKALTLPGDKVWEQNPPKFEKVRHAVSQLKSTYLTRK